MVLFVFRAWQRKLRAYIKCKENEDAIYASLLSLLREPDGERLNSNIDVFIQKWEAQEKEFIQYFQLIYVSRKGIYFVYVVKMHYTQISYSV